MKIRLCKYEDLDQLAEIFVGAFQKAPWNESWTVDIAHKRLEALYNSPGFIGLVVEDEGIIGALMGQLEYWYDGNHFVIKELFISHKNQNKGVGSFLMQNINDYLQEHQVTKIEFFTLNTQQTINFYNKHGYSVATEIIVMKKI